MVRIMMVVAVSSLALIAGPAASADPAYGPWRSSGAVAVGPTVDCDGDGTQETTIATNLPAADEHGAVHLRPGSVAHIAGSTTKMITKGARLEMWVNGAFVAVIDDGFAWGSASGANETCWFEIDSWTDGGDFVQLKVAVSFFATPRA